jgi:hypothetical protein
MQETEVLTGGCFCGAIRFEAAGALACTARIAPGYALEVEVV